MKISLKKETLKNQQMQAYTESPNMLPMSNFSMLLEMIDVTRKTINAIIRDAKNTPFKDHNC
ncbi:hypothetical protein SDC9_173537 [bioreactor metagenome]|uniref:Uncharacterized protein n=1 Tax=bioreactor metagenome TaxID=1076179 RepID=A0A645GR08_9ZZZZ